MESAERVCAQRQRREHSPSATAASAQSPEEVAVVPRICGDQRAVCEDELSLEQVVDTEPRPVVEWAMTATEAPAGDADRARPSRSHDTVTVGGRPSSTRMYRNAYRHVHRHA